MALLDILHYPDVRLHNKAEPVKQVDERIRTLVADMFETMYQADGIGLAAIQVNVPKRVVVIDLGAEQTGGPLALINPEIMHTQGDIDSEEGCLSVPGVFETVRRSGRVRVRFLDLDDQIQEMDVDGLLSRCIQHEIDHLNGKVFVEHLSQLKQDRIRRKIRKQKRNQT